MSALIKGYVTEIKNIDAELKRNRKRVRDLNKRKKLLEGKIRTYLSERQQPGVKFQGIAVYRKEKDIRPSKSQKDRRKDGIEFLENYGIRHADEVLDSLLEAMRGEKISDEIVKIQKIK